MAPDLELSRVWSSRSLPLLSSLMVPTMGQEYQVESYLNEKGIRDII